MKRREKYTFFDFFAICGGAFGLFMGISALSIIELIYYTTLRWFRPSPRPVSKNDTEPNRSEWVKFILIKIVRPVRFFIREICGKSNIHGLRYLTDRSLHWTERSVH